MTECLEIAVVGSGIAGMSAAWLLSRRHRVTMYEADDWIGGHSHTVQAGEIPVDTGFIVYNERTYPNLTALFAHLGVATKPTDMGFAASLSGGRLEYAGTGLAGLFAQKRNLVRPRFWSMLRDLLRFYREAPRDLAGLGAESLGAYLDRGGYGTAFRADHLYPMAAAIWSTPVTDIGDYPASAFIRFCVNHGLLEADLAKRPVWRTVDGGSREYVRRLTAPFAERIVSGCPVRSVRRVPGGADVVTDAGTARFDHVVMATHADQALRLLEDADPEERAVLSAFGYRRNEAVLHTDATLMPRRRAVWSAWNYVADGQGTDASLCVTYWMNRLQGIDERSPLFVTLNPRRAPAEGSVIRTDMYEHPVFDAAAVAAQARLWGLQCVRRTWFCGAYFGAGFHEDGLQAGLAVAEQLGGVRRPWNVAEESGRIRLGRAAEAAELAAA
jgi:predicted NAD/FAD-binding protein